MFPGILALVERSLRADARSLASHLARFGLIVAIYIALCVGLEQSAWFGAPGLRFFTGIAYLNVTFMSLLGIGYFSTTISEEKEEHTLGLMLMAGISPLGILIGKSGGRLLQALLLIAVQYPFTLLAITMGGITTAQVNAVALYLRWGSVPLGTAICIGLFFGMLTMERDGVWGLIAGLFFLVICVVCQLMIALRISSIVEK